MWVPWARTRGGQRRVDLTVRREGSDLRGMVERRDSQLLIAVAPIGGSPVRSAFHACSATSIRGQFPSCAPAAPRAALTRCAGRPFRSPTWPPLSEAPWERQHVRALRSSGASAIPDSGVACAATGKITRARRERPRGGQIASVPRTGSRRCWKSSSAAGCHGVRTCVRAWAGPGRAS